MQEAMMDAMGKEAVRLYTVVSRDKPTYYDKYNTFDSDLAVVESRDLYDFACPDAQGVIRATSSVVLLNGAAARMNDFPEDSVERAAAERLGRVVGEVLCNPDEREKYDEYLLWSVAHHLAVQLLVPGQAPLTSDERERAVGAFRMAVKDDGVAEAIVAGFEQANRSGAGSEAPGELADSCDTEVFIPPSQRADDGMGVQTAGMQTIPSPYGAQGWYDAQDSYSTSDSHGTMGSYSVQEHYGPPDPYGVQGSYGAQGSYGVLDPYGVSGPKPGFGAAPMRPVVEVKARKRGKRPSVVLAVIAVCLALAFCGVELYLAGTSGESSGSSASASSESASTSMDSTKAGASDGLSVDEETFPDQYLREAMDAFDTDNDGVLSHEEIAAVERLDLHGTQVKSLDGLDQFDGVVELDISSCPQLSEVDFGMFPELESLAAAGTQLSSADFSSNPSLANLELDDSVVVSGLDATHLREQWQVTSYSQTGFGGDNPSDRAVDSGNWSATYAYNDDNTLANSEKRDSAGVVITEFSYDGSGRLTQVSEYANGSLTSELFVTYENSGIILEKHLQDGSTRRIRCILDASGRPSEIVHDGRDYIVRYEYQGEDGLLAGVHYREEGKEYSSDFRYESGRIVDKYIGGYSGGVQTYTYSYDEQGRCTGRVATRMGSDDILSAGAYSYDSDGRLQCDGVQLEYDKHGNIVKRTFGGSSRGAGTSEISYRRVFTSKDAADVFQPLSLGDPALAPIELLPCTVNLMQGQDPIARHTGPFVMRSV